MDDKIKELDIESRLLLNSPLYIESIGSIYPLLLDEILIKIGISDYNEFLGLLCCNKEDLIANIENEDILDEITPYLYVQTLCKSKEKVMKLILLGLESFLKQKISYTNFGFMIGEFNPDKPEYLIINEDNFDELAKVLKIQNCLNSKVNKPKNSFEKKLEEMRKKYNKCFNNKEKNVDDNNLNDIISAVCAKHPSINLLNIGNLTIYQLIDQFKRLNAIDTYHININSLIHGASKDESLKHWSSKL